MHEDINSQWPMNYFTKAGTGAGLLLGLGGLWALTIYNSFFFEI